MVIIAGSHRKKIKKAAVVPEETGQEPVIRRRLFQKENTGVFAAPSLPMPESLKKHIYNDRLYVTPLPFWQAVNQKRCLFFASGMTGPDGADMLVCGCARAEETTYPYCAHHLMMARPERPDNA